MQPFSEAGLCLLPTVFERETILTTCLQELPAMRALHLPMAELNRTGWREDRVLDRYKEACERLAHWCMRHNKHAYGIKNPAAALDIARLFSRSDTTHPMVERCYRKITDGLRGLTQPLNTAVEKFQRLRYGVPSSCSELSPRMRPGDPILVIAQFQAVETAGSHDLHLLDTDSSSNGLQLHMTREGKQNLVGSLGSLSADKHPCRILGILCRHNGSFGIQVLRLELALPLLDEPRAEMVLNQTTCNRFKSIL